MSKFSKGLIFSLFVVALFAAPSFGATWIVDEAGSANTYPTLSDAFDAIVATTHPCDSFHIVEIWPGAYTDADLTVPLSVGEIYSLSGATFTGDGTLDFLNIDDVAHCHDLSIHDMDVSGYVHGFEVLDWDGLTNALSLHNNMLDGNDYGIVVRAPVNDVDINANMIINSAFDGIWCDGDDNLIDENTVSNGGGYAVNMRAGSDGNTLTDNCFSGHGSVAPAEDEANDIRTGDNTWAGNDYDDYDGAGCYNIDGGVEWDCTPTSAQATVTAIDVDGPAWEVLTDHVVDFLWGAGAC